MVDNGACAESPDRVGGGLDYRANDVEQDGYVDDLETTEYVGDLSCRRLGRSGDDGSDDIDGGDERMLTKGGQGSRLGIAWSVNIPTLRLNRKHPLGMCCESVHPTHMHTRSRRLQ